MVNAGSIPAMVANLNEMKNLNTKKLFPNLILVLAGAFALLSEVSIYFFAIGVFLFIIALVLILIDISNEKTT